MTILPERRPEPPARPISGFALGVGALAAYGAFALLISLVAAFSNGAHANQRLSGATWKELGTGGGITTGLVLLVAWGVGGYIAGRVAGRDGVRHGAWVFVVGVVLFTVVSAAVTWLPDTAQILRNMRLLGLPVRRAEWRDVGSIAGIASLAGMAVGAVLGGWRSTRLPRPAPAVLEPAPAPAVVPAPEREVVVEPVVTEPVLVESPTEPVAQPLIAPEPVFAGDASVAADGADDSDVPVWWADEAGVLEEPEVTEEPASTGSWWPEQATEPQSQSRPYDDAWALPDDEPPPPADHEPDSLFAFPPSPSPAPVPAPTPAPATTPVPAAPAAAAMDRDADEDADAEPEPPPLAEHADWAHERGVFQAPPDPGREGALQHIPEAMPADEDPDEEARRRQREEAARAYEQAREDQ
ncbi:MAG: hypothetical protein JWP02_1562 [Acidimicrobiales bacterium]|nr:hypothetical protein [Acidimicrobiales bacterium]